MSQSKIKNPKIQQGVRDYYLIRGCQANFDGMVQEREDHYKQILKENEKEDQEKDSENVA